MAETSFGVNHPLAVKLWRKKLFQESLKETFIFKFMGRSTSSVVQILDDTSKSAGDRIRVGLRMQLSGDGVPGDGTLEGNEEELTTYYDDIIIDQLRHAVKSAGKMSEQRVPFSVREEARAGLQDWWSDRIDTWFFNQLGGYTPAIDKRYTGNQGVIAPDADHHVWAGSASNDQSLSNDTFSLTCIDKAVERAKVISPGVRPVRINGGSYWVMFLHPYQVTDMRANTTTGQWASIQQAAMAGGNVTKNPIFTGALGMYNGVVMHESVRVPMGVNSSTEASVAGVRRAILCGAQAAAMAYGRDQGGEMSWVEELFDYENKLGVAAGMISGLKKLRFDGKDFGSIVVSTSAAQH